MADDVAIGHTCPMRPPLILLALALACGGPDLSDDSADQDVTARHFYSLQNAPFPGTPNALVHLAKGFDPSGKLNLVVHYHGWANCIQNDGEKTGRACTSGGSVRVAHNLIAQADASGVNAALVLIERAK